LDSGAVAAPAPPNFRSSRLSGSRPALNASRYELPLKTSMTAAVTVNTFRSNGSRAAHVARAAAGSPPDEHHNRAPPLQARPADHCVTSLPDATNGACDLPRICEERLFPLCPERIPTALPFASRPIRPPDAGRRGVTAPQRSTPHPRPRVARDPRAGQDRAQIVPHAVRDFYDTYVRRRALLALAALFRNRPGEASPTCGSDCGFLPVSCAQPVEAPVDENALPAHCGVLLRQTMDATRA
jgi:hypothetical protein